ncbi:unknown-like [Tropilaelaps mercedesae]|uniref:Molybdopterin synthase sulfur carrier subunit n=1 Tax=Tropilaelaps mercedesae TaxID=418985 RepID=A0A1V9XN96_9ACAR|nr:unknown-like [Tropilaelaps mercedesae]
MSTCRKRPQRFGYGTVRPMVRVKLLFFAKARDLAGVEERLLDIEQGLLTLDKLKQIIGEAEPSVKPVLDSSIVAVDLEYVVDNIEIGVHTNEIALIPPVSGG